MAWDLDGMNAIGHRDVLALPDNFKAGIFKRPYRLEVVYARKPWHYFKGGQPRVEPLL
jgi:hypothetical protein